MSPPTIESFTAVIPAFNPGRFIDEALQSVADQVERPAWVVVIDDGSSDGTYELATHLLHCHRLAGAVLRQTNQGISFARNVGLAARKTNWIALLDADDLWLPDHLKALRLAIETCPNAVVVFGDSRYFGDPRSRTELLARKKTLILSEQSPSEDIHILSDKVFDALLPGLFIPVSASAFRMDCGQSEPRFDEELGSGEDRFFFLQMSRRGKFVFVDRQGARTRRHSHNTTHHFNAVRLNSDLLMLLQKIDRSRDFELNAEQRRVVANEATTAAELLIYAASCEGWAVFRQAWPRAARFLQRSPWRAIRHVARAVAVTLRFKKAGQPDKPHGNRF